MKRFLITGGLLLMAACSSRAFNGNELLEDCQNEQSDMAQGMCNGYIAAVYGMSAYSPDSEFFRFPTGTSGKQIRDTVVKYLVDNPELRASGAFVLVAVALTKVFPGKTPLRFAPVIFPDGHRSLGIAYPNDNCEIPKSANY